MKNLKTFVQELDEAGRCWTGYKPVKGKKPYSQGSCVKEEEELEEKRGLWDNIHARRKKGLPPKKPGQKGYPKTLNIEEVELDESGNKPVEKSYFGMGDSRTPRDIKNQMRGASDKFVKSTAGSKTGPFHSKVAKMQGKMAKSELRRREKGVKEEVEQIDELNLNTLSSYARKAEKSASAMGKQSQTHSDNAQKHDSISKMSRTMGDNRSANKHAKSADAEITKRDNMVSKMHKRLANVDKANNKFTAKLDEGEAWTRKEGQSEAGGLNRKGIASYRAANPGSKLSMAVTTKPSKLKAGSKAANRRKSFCSRMGGLKRKLTSSKTANDPNSRVNKALRKWNC